MVIQTSKTTTLWECQWYKTADEKVDYGILAQLLLRSECLTTWENEPVCATVDDDEISAVEDIQETLVQHMQQLLHSECIFQHSCVRVGVFVFVCVSVCMLVVCVCVCTCK